MLGQNAPLSQRFCSYPFSFATIDKSGKFSSGKSPVMCCAWHVSRPIDSLPDDIDALRALALNAIAERDAVIAERERLIELNDRLRRLLRKAQGFEPKSERLAKLHPDQLNLALEDLEQAIAKAEASEEKSQAASLTNQQPVSADLLHAENNSLIYRPTVLSDENRSVEAGKVFCCHEERR
jgi:hypothetical protein